jgi:uncharacterized protein YerC
MDINNIPGRLTQFGLLEASDIVPDKDLIVISKQLNNLRNGSQYLDLPITVAEAKTLLRGYKVYSVLVSQSKAAPPTVIELENGLGAITISRTINGIYHVSAPGLLTRDKTFVFMGQGQAALEQRTGVYGIYNLDLNGFDIWSSEAGQPSSDSILEHTALEIRVYL